MARRAERGYALVMAAFALLFLAIAAAAVVHATAESAMTAKLENDQAGASAVAAAGLEWALEAGTVGTQSFGDGSFTVTSAGRKLQSTGTYGLAKRVASCERTLQYVPESRWVNSGTNVAFEVYNTTGSDLVLQGLTTTTGATAFYGDVDLVVLGDAEGDAAVDYGVIWSYTLNNGGVRAGSGTSITFGAAPVVPAGRQALVTLGGWNSAASGSGSALTMDSQELRVNFRDAAGLAATAVPRVQ